MKKCLLFPEKCRYSLGKGLLLCSCLIFSGPGLVTHTLGAPHPAAVLQSENVAVKGKVVDENGEPLPGASVRVKDTNQAVTTDADGNFTLSGIADNAVLVVSYLGFITQEVPVDNQTTLQIVMQENTQSLNEVVVVGYGTQKKVNLTGAISTVEMSEKEGQPLTNVSNALHGTPGLFVNLGNSQPGVDRSTIRIRGMGTLNNNNPLVLVDGIEYSMDELNPADIESVSVLKDASAAIYGSRAANGVILVTTKKGNGKPKVNYSFYTGIQNPTVMPDAIWDPIAYMHLKNQALENIGKVHDYSDAEIAEYEQGMKTDPFTYPASNWFDIALDNGTIQKHDISVSGSTDKYQYRVSLGYLDRKGILIGPNDQEKKYSLGLNASMNVSERLKVGLTLDGYYRHYNEPYYNSIWSYLSRTLPILTDTLADGRYGDSWLRTPGRNNWENPRMILETGYSKKTVNRFLTTVFADYQLPFDISYHAKLGADKYDGLLQNFTPQVKHYNPKTEKATNWNSPSTAPRSRAIDYNELNLHFYHTLNWDKTFAEKHNVSIMLGGSYDNYDDISFSSGSYGYLDGTLTAISAGSLPYEGYISGSSNEDVLISYFGRINYDFKGKYLLEGTFRYDGSSRFATGNRWGFFPAVSAGWRIDKEPFFHLTNVFDLLKLRASYGELGNQAVPLYSYENSINLGQDYSFGGVLASGAAATAYSDPNISWETTTAYDLGLDAYLLNNRISFSADVYKKYTTDILRAVNIPDQVGGLGGPNRNIGAMRNTGFELVLGYQNDIGDFSYAVNGNVSYNKNEVVDLNGEILYGFDTNLSTITQAGYPVNSYFIYDAIGIFQSADEVASSPFQSATTTAGDLKYRDVNGDNKITSDDRVIISTSTQIPKYTFGFGLDLGYKGFTLNALFQGVTGLKVYPTANLAFPFNNGANATWEWVTDSWTPERPDAPLPQVTPSDVDDDNYVASDFWLQDGSYLRMKNIQLSYALPAKWLSQVKISGASVYLNAQNILTFSKYEGFDPESIVNASTIYHYPMLKTVSAGFNVTF
ncbi:TonB-dependent receptor [Pontibacter sp. 172403-2]|nr:TonB-dependent receptor [Pontibacter sp. 172403-2]MBF9255451.1 TonB-dependent receptor [Pontibacter sp. 172403-2]